MMSLSWTQGLSQTASTNSSNKEIKEAWSNTPFIVKQAYAKCVYTNHQLDTIIEEGKELLLNYEDQVTDQKQINIDLTSNVTYLTDSLIVIHTETIPDIKKEAKKEGFWKGFKIGFGTGSGIVIIIGGLLVLL